MSSEPTTEHELIAFAEKALKCLVNENQLIKKTAIQRKKWKLMLLHGYLFTNREIASWFCDAARAQGYKEIYAVRTENWIYADCSPNREDFVFKLATSNGELERFSGTYSFMNYLLVPLDLSFALLTNLDLATIVAGPEELIRAPKKSTIAEAERKFNHLLDEKYKGDSIHQFHKNIYNYYFGKGNP